jgi:hypothetical protein
MRYVSPAGAGIEASGRLFGMRVFVAGLDLVERHRNPEAVRCRCRNRGRYRASG